MQIRACLADRPPYNKFLILVGLTLIGAVLFTAIGAMLSSLLYGVDMTGDPSIVNQDADPQVAAAFRLFQGLAAIGTFILPAWMAAYLFSGNEKEYLGLTKKPGISVLLMVFFLLIAAVPFINWMMQVNSALHLPAFLKGMEDWMIASEKQAENITKLLLGSTAVSDLLINLLVIAIIPAVGEELLFRGVIQKQFTALTHSKGAAVVLTAILFSALHMQFFGFLPRFALGVLLGYLYVWSGSIWLPVLAHFFNNATAVLLVWVAEREGMPFNPDTIGTEPDQALLLGGSVLLTWTIIWMLRGRLLNAKP